LPAQGRRGLPAPGQPAGAQQAPRPNTPPPAPPLAPQTNGPGMATPGPTQQPPKPNTSPAQQKNATAIVNAISPRLGQTIQNIGTVHTAKDTADILVSLGIVSKNEAKKMEKAGTPLEGVVSQYLAETNQQEEQAIEQQEAMQEAAQQLPEQQNPQEQPVPQGVQATQNVPALLGPRGLQPPSPAQKQKPQQRQLSAPAKRLGIEHKISPVQRIEEISKELEKIKGEISNSNKESSIQDTEGEKEITTKKHLQDPFAVDYAHMPTKQLNEVHKRNIFKLQAAQKEFDEEPTNEFYKKMLSQAEEELKKSKKERDLRLEWQEENKKEHFLNRTKESGVPVISDKQYSEIISNKRDVYRDSNAKKEVKGYDKAGNEIIGYEYSPHLFVKSDISGMPIRHYVKLPDGRIAHPDEIYEAKKRGNLIVEKDFSPPPYPVPEKEQEKRSPEPISSSKVPSGAPEKQIMQAPKIEEPEKNPESPGANRSLKASVLSAPPPKEIAKGEHHRGDKVEFKNVPEKIYHVTTNLPAVNASGVLKPFGGKKGAGLGGAHKVVSFTTSKKIAEDLENDIKLSMEFFNKFPEDSSSFDAYEWLQDKAKQEGFEFKYYTDHPDFYDNGWIKRKAKEMGYSDVTEHPNYSAPKGRRETINEVEKLSLFKEYMDKRAEKTGKINPRFLNRITGDPNNVSIIQVDKNNVPENARQRIRTGDSFLDEVAVYAEVPINENYKTKKIPHHEALEALGKTKKPRTNDFLEKSKFSTPLYQFSGESDKDYRSREIINSAIEKASKAISEGYIFVDFPDAWRGSKFHFSTASDVLRLLAGMPSSFESTLTDDEKGEIFDGIDEGNIYGAHLTPNLVWNMLLATEPRMQTIDKPKSVKGHAMGTNKTMGTSELRRSLTHAVYGVLSGKNITTKLADKIKKITMTANTMDLLNAAMKQGKIQDALRISEEIQSLPQKEFWSLFTEEVEEMARKYR